MKCCNLTSGKLRHSIVIERATKTGDGGGGSSNVWNPVATIRSFIKPISGGERFQAMRIEADTTHRIFIRYRADILTSDRVNYGGRLMQIRALINLEEMNKWVEIYADENEKT